MCYGAPDVGFRAPEQKLDGQEQSRAASQTEQCGPRDMPVMQHRYRISKRKPHTDAGVSRKIRRTRWEGVEDTLGFGPATGTGDSSVIPDHARISTPG